MNAFKKTGGFTLVELIIVIAILAILSSVAVAGYSSYIKNANDSAVESFLNDMKTHIALANAKGGAVTKIEVDADGTVRATVDQVADDFQDNFKDAYKIVVSDEDITDNATDSDTIVFQLPKLPANSWTGSSYGKTGGAEWANNEWKEVKVTAFNVYTAPVTPPVTPNP